MVYTIAVPADLAELTGISGSFGIIRAGIAPISRYTEECARRGYTDSNGDTIPAFNLPATCMYLQICVISVPQQLGADITEALERMPPEIFEWLSEEVARINSPLAKPTSEISTKPTSEADPEKI